MALVSVVTPVYNGSAYLDQCIESVMGQSFRDWEYVIVDNCSTDGTLEIAQSYAKKDRRIRIECCKDFLPMTANFNRAASLASPETRYLKYVCADDMLFPDCLRMMVELAESNPKVELVGSYKIWGDRVSVEGPPFPKQIVTGKNVCRTFFEEKGGTLGSETNHLIRRSSGKAPKCLFDETYYHSDTEFYIRLLKDEADFGFIHQVLTFSRVHDGMASNYSFQNGIAELEYLALLMKYGSSFFTKQELARQMKRYRGMQSHALFRGFIKAWNREIWNFQVEKSKKLNVPVRMLDVITAGMAEAVTGILKPKETIERLKREFCRTRDQGLRKINGGWSIFGMELMKTVRKKLGKSPNDIGSERGRSDTPRKANNWKPRVALLTPYSGHNLGDSAIQDSMIAQLRQRLPEVFISGITLNSDNFLERHGNAVFPLSAMEIPFYGICHGQVDNCGKGGLGNTRVGKMLRDRSPKLWNILRKLREFLNLPLVTFQEVSHWFKGFCFIRNHDILIVSGGGQLDEEWGGPWGHPYSLFKWALLSRAAGVPLVFSSVGACKTDSRVGRFFMSWALRIAKYRSYREVNSRKIAVDLFGMAHRDPVVPDLAFSLKFTNTPTPGGIREMAKGRFVVAVSPIAFGRPGSWVAENKAIYNRYLRELAQVILHLVKQECYVVLVWSDLGDKVHVTPDLLDCLNEHSSVSRSNNVYVSDINRWQDFMSTLQEADLLIASRLHSSILGVVARLPLIAISFDPKVDWLMEDLGQTDFLLQISDFKYDDVIKAVEQIRAGRCGILEEISTFQKTASIELARQYDLICEMIHVRKSKTSTRVIRM